MKGNDDNQSAKEVAPSFRVGKWFPDLDESILKKLSRYNDELNRFNKALNLVSPKTLPLADLLHFSDSILASRLIVNDQPDLSSISDLGSGNGFPGLVFALLYPRIEVTLIDSDQRKTEFLKHLSSALELKNVKVLCQTIDTLSEGSIEFCMARGLASISKAIFLGRKIVSPGGAFYHLKSEEWSMEVSEIPSQLCSIWSPSLLGEYKLPMGEIRFSIVKTEKIR